MRTISMLSCLFLVIYGCIFAFTYDFTVGSILLIIGGLSFLIIAPKTKKIEGYNPKDFMNR